MVVQAFDSAMWLNNVECLVRSGRMADCSGFMDICRKLHVQLETAHCVGAASNGAATNGSATANLPGRASFSCIQMNGQEVFKFAVRSVPQVVEGALLEAGMTSKNIDWLLLHQVRAFHCCFRKNHL